MATRGNRQRPVRRVARHLCAPAVDASTYSSGAPRVLLVEDHPLNADVLVRRLLRRGFVVSLATDGLAAVAAATREQPDLILMDISLPGIDGWEATRRLKANSLTASIPVIVLTAHAMVTDREKSFAAGCQEFETKPVDLDRLLAKMRALLRVPVLA